VKTLDFAEISCPCIVLIEYSYRIAWVNGGNNTSANTSDRIEVAARDVSADSNYSEVHANLPDPRAVNVILTRKRQNDVEEFRAARRFLAELPGR
jgi:hypothetical protein